MAWLTCLGLISGVGCTVQPLLFASATASSTVVTDESLVSDGAYCDAAATWSPLSTQLEDEMLALVNNVRRRGADCGSQGRFGAAGPLSMSPQLRCAARNHSRDIVERGFFDHTNPDGEGPSDRMARTGYEWSYWGENLALGLRTPEQVLAGWLRSPGHCASLMKPEFTETGVGQFSSNVWTMVYASPKE